MSWWSNPKVEAEIGARYRLINRPIDPWGIKQPIIVIVLERKDGWVKYRYDDSDECHASIEDMFISIFEKVVD